MNNALITANSMNLAAPLGSLDAYVHWANKMPILSAEEEQTLSTQLIEQGDLNAARQLISSHLRFVIKIARGYAGYGLAQADLIQEGNIGLMKAVKRFNPKVGVRLVSFAVHWVKAEIHEFILKNWRIVRIATTKAQRKLFFNLRSMKNRLGWFTKDEVDDVAKTLNVKPSEIVEMEERLYAHDMAFDMNPEDDDSFSSVLAPEEFLSDESLNPARLLEDQNTTGDNKTRLMVAFKELDDRSQDILKSRWMDDKKATLHDLAARYKISAERVRQLEQQAMKQIKDALVIN
jgi:RNA polymerase sigma-32 factor